MNRNSNHPSHQRTHLRVHYVQCNEILSRDHFESPSLVLSDNIRCVNSVDEFMASLNGLNPKTFIYKVTIARSDNSADGGLGGSKVMSDKPEELETDEDYVRC